MKKLFRVTLAAIVFMAGACASCSSVQVAPAQPTESLAIKRALLATVALMKEGHLFCAGERISRTQILTAYHCAVVSALSVDDLTALTNADGDLMAVPASRVLGRTADYQTYSDMYDNSGGGCSKGTCPIPSYGLITKADSKHDLAVITTLYSTQPYVEVSSQILSVGQEVFAIGHPAGLSFTYARGWVSSPCRLDGRLPDGCWTQVDITIWGGSSGGGLYDMSGRLVGVASMMLRPGQAFFVTPQFVSGLVNSPQAH